jgi:hypothetical protein
MTLSQKHRHTIFERLSPTLGEEETEALLSHFPIDQGDQPVTAARFDTTMSQVRADMSQVRADMSQLRSDMQTDMARLEASIVERMRQQIMWSFGAMISGMGVAAAISQAVG